MKTALYGINGLTTYDEVIYLSERERLCLWQHNGRWNGGRQIRPVLTGRWLRSHGYEAWNMKTRREVLHKITPNENGGR